MGYKFTLNANKQGNEVEEIAVAPTLEEMQKAVGGLIELVQLGNMRGYLPDGTEIEGNHMLVINAEGLINDSAINETATNIAHRTIVGDVLMLVGLEID